VYVCVENFVVALHPYFFQRVTLQNQVPVPQVSGFGSGTFRLRGYAQVQDYTLLAWEYSQGGELFTGETLYFKRDLVVHGGGRLTLYQPGVQSYKGSTDLSPFIQGYTQLIAERKIGLYGIPVSVAIALRDTGNWIFFE
jgi:hypothetical protein